MCGVALGVLAARAMPLFFLRPDLPSHAQPLPNWPTALAVKPSLNLFVAAISSAALSASSALPPLMLE